MAARGCDRDVRGMEKLKLKLKMIPYIIRTHNELVLGGGVVRASDPARCSWRKTPPPIAS